ncbi:TPA: hypothetical protein QCX06_002113 [Bacillus paranthracis]|nr:hypothetical protein [Bacillus paranthracis]HDR7304510.1 hypothetical protein [Bacillus paranthracis]
MKSAEEGYTLVVLDEEFHIRYVPFMTERTAFKALTQGKFVGHDQRIVNLNKCQYITSYFYTNGDVTIENTCEN